MYIVFFKVSNLLPSNITSTYFCFTIKSVQNVPTLLPTPSMRIKPLHAEINLHHITEFKDAFIAINVD